MAAHHPFVFDADIHLHELDSDLAPYFELPWRRVLEEGGADLGVRSVRGERFLDVPGYSPYTIYDPILGDLPTEEPHRILSADVLRADLDARGTDAALIFPGRLLRAATSNDDLYVTALQRAYNQCLAERWIDPARGVYAAIMAANQVPEAAADDVTRYAATPGFVAVYLPLGGNYPLWGDRQYEPLFAVAEEANLPIVLQGTVTIHTVFPYQLHHVPTALAKQTLSQPFGVLANLVTMLTNGVLARHPRLQIVINDAGLGWLPYLTDRLDSLYRYLKDEVPYLDLKPSEYVRRQVYLTTHPLGDPGNGAYVAACLAAIGDDHVLFGSDWPHFDADIPSRVRDLPITDAAKQRILGENARTLFRLGPVNG